MKAKKIVPMNAVRPQAVKPPTLPDPPFIPQDVVPPIPTISQAEITDYINARDAFLIVRADYVHKEAALTLKLLQGCLPELGSHIARLEDGGEKLVVLDHCSCCHSSTEGHEQCSSCHSWRR